MNFLLSLIIGVIIGILLAIFIELIYKIIKKHTKKEPTFKFKGFHFHHSTLGLLIIPLLFVTFSTLLLGLSLGIIARHSRKEKFVFIERVKS